MDERVALAEKALKKRKPGVRRQRDRELAWRLWAGEAGRSDRATARLISGDPHYVSNVTVDTVRGWRKTDKWDERADREGKVLGQALPVRSADLAERGAYEALGLLTRIVVGSETETVVTLEGERFEAKPKLRDRIAAARILLEASKKIGAGAAKEASMLRVVDVTATSRRALTDDERKALAASINKETEA